jgi:uncharacterized protein YcbX
MPQPVLSQLNSYPLKSAGGISLANSNLDQRGLVHDRRWMVVDDSGQFMSQRTSPEMALINTEIDGQTLILNAPRMSELCLPLFPTTGESQEVEIWGDRCEAWTADPQVELWISEYLGKSCKIVFMPDHSKRPVDPDFTVDEKQVAFSDGFPLLLISEASLNELNSRLPESVAMKRFRPNLVVKDTEPYAEDSWKKIIIGECEFHVVKPCSRCILTTVDPETGEFSGKEPLRTLATYRKLNGKVMFGQNLIATKIGKLEVGMSVEII